MGRMGRKGQRPEISPQAAVIVQRTVEMKTHIK